MSMPRERALPERSPESSEEFFSAQTPAPAAREYFSQKLHEPARPEPPEEGLLPPPQDMGEDG